MQKCQQQKHGEFPITVRILDSCLIFAESWMDFGKSRIQPVVSDSCQMISGTKLTVWHIESSFRLFIFFGFLLSLLFLSPCGLTQFLKDGVSINNP